MFKVPYKPLAKRLLKKAIRALKFGLGPTAKVRERAAEALARQQSFSTEWTADGNLARRHYDSYEAYLAHQASKLGKIATRLERHEQDDFEVFLSRFKSCSGLRGARNVLCLGARLGTEVRALQTLGHFAVGVDLNPGRNNTLVLIGDFHKLSFADSITDCVYTNALDHTFDLRTLALEVHRVLRPGGVFIADVVSGFKEGFTPGAFEATYWADLDSLVSHLSEWTGFVLEERRPVASHGNEPWIQLVFRKPASPSSHATADFDRSNLPAR